MTDYNKTADYCGTDQRKSIPLGKRGAPLLLAGAVGVALLAGCGGGGGNGNNGGNSGTGSTGSTGTTGTTGSTGTNSGTITNASVIGKVVDVNGNGVPGANLNVDSGGVIAKSLGQGGYQINNLTGGVVHQITAAVTRQDGIVYTGSTQVVTQGGNIVSNANIILSPQGQQATIGGTVVDTSNNPISGVEVFLAVPNKNNISSLVAFTDGNGHYVIGNVPSSLPAGQVTITASIARAANQTFSLNNLSAGGTYSQNFSLSGANGIRLAPPAIQAVFTSTEPTDSLSGAIRTGHVAGGAVGGVYDALRRRLSPAYARLSARRQGVGKRRIAHATGSGYAIETDVAFDTPNATSGSVAGYDVYLTTGTNNPPVQGIGDQRDFLQDPQANYYTDLSFAGDAGTGPFVPYAPQGQYNFALDAVSTDRPSTTSTLSSPFSVVPLGPLTLTQPQIGQALASNPTISWNAVRGVSRYFVFIYDQYPTAEVQPIYATPDTPAGTSPVIPGNVTSVTLSLGLHTQATYYAVVSGVNDQTEGADINGQAVTVISAAASFSQITRFNVPQ